MTTYVRIGLNPVRSISLEYPFTQVACTKTAQFVRGCTRRNHPSLRVRAVKRAASFRPLHLPAANAATQPSGTCGTLARFISLSVFSRGAITPPEKEPPVQCPCGG